jgi:branched-chain amino acid aminotransferase
MPTASCLHYATECFEGLKAYRGYDGKLRVFRTEHNAARMQMSCSRISLPCVDATDLQQLIYALLTVDAPKWLPKDRAGDFLYIQPMVIGTQLSLGVQAPQSATMYILLGYMPRVNAVPCGIKLLTSLNDMVRSWIGGFGYAKVSANYRPLVLASQAAAREGFHQTLWLYGEEGECTEAGGSKFFVVWLRKDGKKEVILDGVTRRSCLELARERFRDLVVTERKFTIDEVINVAADGCLLESLSAGMAVSVSIFFFCSSNIRHVGSLAHTIVVVYHSGLAHSTSRAGHHDFNGSAW